MLKYILNKQLQRLKNYMLFDTFKAADSSLMLLGKIYSSQVRQEKVIESLTDVEFKVYSQWGEDGIIEWLIQRLPISERNFIEFGVGNYKESNTRFLVQNHNWRGLVIDANMNWINDIHNDPIYMKHDLTACHAFITRDNINDIIASNGFTGKIGLLSVDIDGNDYWVWDAIEVVKPDIVVCEYNALFGDIHPITVTYDANFQRKLLHYSNLCYGASIKALEIIAARKGYILIGSNSTGSNAFFI